MKQNHIDHLPKPFADCYGCEEECTYEWPDTRIIEEIQKLKIKKVTVENQLIPVTLEKKLSEKSIELLTELCNIQKRLEDLWDGNSCDGFIIAQDYFNTP